MQNLIEKFDGSRHWFGVHFLRLALSALFLWFGFSQIFDGSNWIGYVPDWALNLFHVSSNLIVLTNGVFEVVMAALMAMGFMVRLAAFVLALHLIPIALSSGLSAIAVRDLALASATLSLSFVHGNRKRKLLTTQDTNSFH